MNVNAPVLLLNEVSAGYRGRPVLQNFTLRLEPAERLALIGPNGVGKTTFLQVATGLLPCRSGSVRLFGEDAARMPARRRARLVGVVAQEMTSPMAFTVGEMVMMGRNARLARWRPPAPRDRAAVEEAMEMTGTLALRGRVFQQLSSGERQRVAMAMALAVQPRLLLLDEAASHLDMTHRMELVEIIRNVNAARRISVVMIVHDLNLAAEFFPRIALMSDGRIVADGTPEEVLREDLLARAYGCAVTVRRDHSAGCLRVFPSSTHHA